MKKNVIFAIGTMYVALALIATSATLSSCQKQEINAPFSTDALEIKSVLDSVAAEKRAPELELSLAEIELALNNEHPQQIAQRNACNDFMFCRIHGGEKEYRADITTVLTYLGVFGTTTSTIDPKDVNDDEMINMIDFLTVLGGFGVQLDQPSITSVETVGGEVSGTGELALFTGDLLINGDEVEIIEIFPPSNCFIQDYDASEDYDPANCYDGLKVTFETTAGNVKYLYIN